MSSQPTTAEMSESATTRGGVANGIAAVLGTGLGFAMTFFITRHYGVAATGTFFGAIALFMVVATATKLGVETALVRYVARLRAVGDLGRAVRLTAQSALVVTVVSIAAAAGLHRGAAIVAGWFGDPDWSVEFAAVTAVLAWFVPVWAVGLCLLGATRGSGTMRPTAYGLGLAQPALQLGAVAVAANADASLRGLALAWGLPLVAPLVIAATTLSRRLGPSGPVAPSDDERASTTVGASEVEEAVSGFWSYALWRGLAGTLQMGLDRVGILVVGAVSTAAVAGQWAAISRLVGVAQRVFHAIGQALNPRIAALADRGDWAGVNRSADRITALTAAALVPALVGLICFPAAALGLFGDDFGGGATGLRIAAAAVLAATVLAHADNVLLMAGHARLAMFNTAAALAVATGLYLVLVPRWQAAGAAGAFAAGIAVYRLAAAGQIRRRHGATVFGPATTRVLKVGLGLVAVLMVGGRVVGGDNLATAVVTGAVATGIYAIVLLIVDRVDRLLRAVD